ncbi:MAG: hypothetical protein JW737_00010 [Acidobacteria bacterium]|nr:hypothetical protein [Acidobacteriota bacterium]
MNFLITGSGLLATTIGFQMKKSGFDVKHLIIDKNERRKISETGLKLTVYPGKKETYELELQDTRKKTEYDYILCPIRYHQYTDELVEALKPFVFNKTVIVPITSMFDIPQNMINAYKQNITVVAHSFGLAGRELAKNDYLVIIPTSGAHFYLGKKDTKKKKDLKILGKDLNTSGFKIKKTRSPLSIPRIAAAGILAVEKTIKTFNETSQKAELTDQFNNNLRGEFSRIVRLLKTSNRRISFYFITLLNYLHLFSRNWVIKLLHGYFGSDLGNFYRVISREEIKALEKDLFRVN